MKASNFTIGDRVRWLLNGTYVTGTVKDVGRKWVYVDSGKSSPGLLKMYPHALQHIDGKDCPR